jgi:hypothetical protein
MPPQVRDLQQLIAEQTNALKPQLDLINNDIAANDASGQAQELGLQAKQKKAFGNIEQAAQDKGMFFSGFSPDEQANYTSDTYLPALAQLQATIAGARSNLLGKKADLNKGAFDTAFQVREGDVAAKRTWDAAETDRRWQEQQAALERDFKAKESAKDRAAAAAQASAQAGVSASQAFDADRKAMSSELFQVTGNDGFVSPQSYQKAKNNWVGAGYDAKTFDSYYASFRNPGNKNYKLG